MGSPATPITPPAAQPGAASAAPAAVPSTVHSSEDAIFNRLQAKMSAGLPPETTVAPPADLIIKEPAQPQAPPAEGAPPLAAEPVVGGEVNLDDLDFDAAAKPAEQVAKPPETKDGRDPAEIEKELKSEIERLTGEGVGDKALWDKVGAIVLAHPRGQRMMQGLRLHQALMEAPKDDGTGGLGRFPSVDEIKAGDGALREVQQLRHDLTNDPENFVANMFGVAENGQSWLGTADKAAQVAASIPTYLFQAYDQTKSPIYTQMIGAMATPIIERMFDHQYKQALALPAGQTREIVLYSLQVAEHNIVGEARRIDTAVPNGNGTQQTQGDPRYSQLEQQFKQTRDELSRLRQTGQREFVNTLQTTNRSNVVAAVDRVLDHVGIGRVFSAELLAPHRVALAQVMEQELPRINGAGYDNYLRMATDASNGRGSVQAATQLYKKLVENGIKVSPIFRERLNALVKSAGEMSTTRTNARVQAQGQVGTAGTGAPAAASVLSTASKLERLPGENQEDFLTRRFASRMLPQ